MFVSQVLTIDSMMVYGQDPTSPFLLLLWQFLGLTKLSPSSLDQVRSLLTSTHGPFSPSLIPSSCLCEVDD
jgi:hypothetical protein